VEAGAFFRTSTGVISPDSVILQCYQLAKYYHLDPCIFLDKPISEVHRHMMWTGKLEDEVQQAREAMQADNG